VAKINTNFKVYIGASAFACLLRFVSFALKIDKNCSYSPGFYNFVVTVGGQPVPYCTPMLDNWSLIP